MKLNDLQRIYGAAGRELRTLLLAVDLEIFDGVKAETLKKKARRIVTYLNAVSGRWTRSITRTAYARAEKTERARMIRFGKRRPRGPEPNRPGHERVAEVTENALAKAASSIMRTVDQYIAAALMAAAAAKEVPVAVQEFDYAEIEDFISDLAIEAVKKQLARGTLQKQIMDKLRELVGDENFIVIGERTYNLAKYAKMVARTTLRDAQTAATLDVCRLYENDLVQWSDHGTDCPICEQYEGKIFSISGNDPKYPALEESPPAHPNCQHDLLGTSEEEIYVREQGL